MPWLIIRTIYRRQAEEKCIPAEQALPKEYQKKWK
jgi:hypothetical protein